MLNLPQRTFKKIKSLLYRQKIKIEQDIQNIEKTDPSSEDGLAESTEPGTDSWLADVHGRVVTLKQNLQLMLSKTKDSIAKLKTGKYGKCENCGKPIEPARLEAMPTATLCLSCSKKKSKAN